jgi:adenosylmethionine-8-amino-7-oxononanoate aminotransferase
MLRVSSSNIIMSPPLVITAADVSAIIAALDEALAAA